MSTINICFNTDERWLLQAKRALYDIVIRKNPNTKINFYIVFDAFDASGEFIPFKSIPNVTIKTESVNVQKIFNNKVRPFPSSRLGAFKHIKFLLPELDILKDVDRVLYLDVDVLARKDLTELYNYDLGDYALGAVKDYMHLRMSDYNTFFLTSNRVESGFILMDLKKLRELGFTTEAKKKVANYVGDSHLLQVISDDYTAFLPPKYQIPYHCICTEAVFKDIARWNDYCGTNYENINDLVNDSFLWHYCGDKDMAYRTIPSVKISFDLSSKRLNAFLSTGEVMRWKPEDDNSLYINL